MNTPEPFNEQIDRLELMCADDTDYDMSDNDRLAVRAVVDQYRSAIAALKALHDEIKSRFGCDNDMSDQLLIRMIQARAAIERADKVGVE